MFDSSRERPRYLLLSDYVAYYPGLQSVLQLLTPDFDSECGELFCLDRTMQPKLHCHLHHQTAEHKGGIRPLTRGGQRPCAEETESLDDMIVLRNSRYS